MKTLESIFARLSDYDDSTLASFVADLRSILTTAQIKMAGDARKALSVTRGRVDSTASNSRFLRSMAVEFLRKSKDAGLGKLMQSFADSFDGALPFMEDVFDVIRSSVKSPMPSFRVTNADRIVGQSLKLNTVVSMDGLISSVANATAQRALFSVGGLRFTDLTDLMAKQISTTIPKAQTLAATAQSTFYRTIQANQFKRIQDGMDVVLRYDYSGPKDKLNRPFCREMLEKSKSGKRWTEAELRKMDNGSTLSDVWTSCGGWSCRHALIIDVASLEQSLTKAAA